MDAVKSMLPMHVMCRMFGLAYYTIRRKKLDQKPKIESCHWLYKLAFFCSFAFKISTTLNDVRGLVNDRWKSKLPPVEGYTVIFEGLCALSINFVFFVHAFTKKNRQIQLWRDLVDFDEDLRRLKYEINYKLVRLTTWSIIVGQICFILGAAAKTFRLAKFQIFHVALFYEWQFLRIAFRLQIVTWISLLKEIFVAIANGFLDSREQNEVMRLHERACRLLRKFNGIFCVEILFCIGLDFGVVTLLSYYTYTTFFHESQPDDRYTYLIWVSTYVFDLFLLAIVSCKCCLHANCIVKRNLQLVAKDKFRAQLVYRDEMKVFVLQLLHNESKITAGGFLDVNGSLIFTVASAFTTYLVILIQFDLKLRQTVLAAVLQVRNDPTVDWF